MEDDFDMASAVDEVGAGLGLGELDSGDSDDLVIDNSDGVKEVSDKAPLDKPTITGVAKEPVTEATATAAPKTWRAEAAATWATLPKQAQDEILKREQDIFKGIEDLKPTAQLGRDFQAVIQPYAHILQQQNINPIQQVNNLMQAHYTLAFGTPDQKVGLIQELIKDYGIAFQPPATAAEDDYVDPQVVTLRQELAAVKSTLAELNQFRTQSAQEKQQQQELAITSEIDAFAKLPDVPYFQEVSQTMSELLMKGLAENLRDAYDKACRFNPVVAEKILQATVAKQQKEAKEKAAVRVAKVQTSTAANVHSDVREGGATAFLGSFDDTMNETLAAIRKRG